MLTVLHARVKDPLTEHTQLKRPRACRERYLNLHLQLHLQLQSHLCYYLSMVIRTRDIRAKQIGIFKNASECERESLRHHLRIKLVVPVRLRLDVLCDGAKRRRRRRDERKGERLRRRDSEASNALIRENALIRDP